MGFSRGIILHVGGNYLGVEFFKRNLTLGKVTRIPMLNCSYDLLSLCRVNFMLTDVKGNCPG